LRAYAGRDADATAKLRRAIRRSAGTRPPQHTRQIGAGAEIALPHAFATLQRHPFRRRTALDHDLAPTVHPIRAPVAGVRQPAPGRPLADPAADAPADARTITHWTRILHQDLFNAGADDRRPATAEPHVDGDRRAEARPAAAAQAFAARRRDAEFVVLSAADGYPLGGMRYPAPGRARAHLIVAGAVGVPQRFYRRFAEFAAARGYTTLTFDYRGVGMSAPATLDGFRMDYFDWGRLDLAAAVTAMSQPPLPLFVVGHSFGGHAFGMLPNHARVAGYYTFGTGAGWHGWMPPLERLRVLAMWHVLGPLLTRWKGYLSWSLLGLGEDLPLDYYRRWKHWCRFPNYFFGDPAMRYVAREFARVRAPLMAANSIDDRWAPPRSRDAFIAGYRNAARQTLDIDPALVGLRGIGHMGYFKPGARPLWESALAWFEARRDRFAAAANDGIGRPRRIAVEGPR
jgi:predicted alpha/beta hydrolase